jgi:DNA mismatch endonuclease (patch repair protein)
MMAGIRGRDTRLEVRIRTALHARGFRYRLHDRHIPGKPDIVLPRFRATVFVHGCFWHGHDCELFRMPASRTEFWRAKINSNRERDSRVRREIATLGWRQLVIWECAIRGRTRMDFAEAVSRAAAWITGDAQSEELRGSAETAH